MIGIGGFCIFPYIFLNWVSVGQANAASDRYSQTEQAVLATMVDTSFIAMTQAYATMVTPTFTPTVTFTPSPLPSPTNDLPIMEFMLSFYDPRIGYYFPDIAQVNCLQWDDVLRDCVSKVNNGTEHYFVYYRRGVACPPPLRDGQRIRVIEPVELAAIAEEWICIDRGGAIQNYYLDFMLQYPNDIWTGENLDYFPWSSRVLVEVLP